MYITEIDQAFEGDTYFPEIDHHEWKETERIKGNHGEEEKLNYDFVTYEKMSQ